MAYKKRQSGYCVREVCTAGGRLRADWRYRWRWARLRSRKGATAAPVFESEARPVRAHPVLPQELLEPLLQLRLPNLPLIHGRISPKTVAVVNAGIVEAGHRGCCSAAGRERWISPSRLLPPQRTQGPAGTPLAAPHALAALFPRTAPGISRSLSRSLSRPRPRPPPLRTSIPAGTRSQLFRGKTGARRKPNCRRARAASAAARSDWPARRAPPPIGPQPPSRPAPRGRARRRCRR